MSLATRLSAFFLAALALVLVGFSAGLYGLARVHLYRMVDERLDAALATLAAAAEVGREGVEWEPDERELGPGRDPGADQVRWLVRDGRGRLLDRSPNLEAGRLSPETPAGPASGRVLDREGRAWRSKSRRLVAGAASRPGRGAPALVLAAFAPLGPTEATLRRLGLALAGLSAALWTIAALLGRRLCRRALAPLARMAEASRGADASEPGYRLPGPATGDELEDLGRAFNDLLGRLHATAERQRRFAGDASHQLRTPLAAVIGQVEVALRRERSAEEYRRTLCLVSEQAGQLRRIVEALLFLARAEAEAGRPDRVVLDLSAWLPEQVRPREGHGRTADVSLVVADGPSRVLAHPPLLALALENLLDNAFKYGEPGTPIVVRLAREPEAVTLAVEDRGRGIAPGDLPRVFEPFFRADPARASGRPGVGLGLSVAQRIAIAHGGRLDAASEPGRGSRFTLRLPPAAEPPPEADGESDRPTSAPTDPGRTVRTGSASALDLQHGGPEATREIPAS